MALSNSQYRFRVPTRAVFGKLSATHLANINRRKKPLSRISKIPVEHWNPELVSMTAGDTATVIEQGITRMLAHCPEMAKGAIGFGAAITINRTLPERLIELVRLRVAYHNQCRSCMAIRYSSVIAGSVIRAIGRRKNSRTPRKRMTFMKRQANC